MQTVGAIVDRKAKRQQLIRRVLRGEGEKKIKMIWKFWAFQIGEFSAEKWLHAVWE